MIVDSSAIIAILDGEDDGYRFTNALSHATEARMSAGTFLETSIVVDANRDPVLSARLDELLETHNVAIEPVTVRQAVLARRAHRDYGRGSGHPAQLNFGDCFAYALARDSGQPLLFKGEDFFHTDVRSALDRDSR